MPRRKGRYPADHSGSECVYRIAATRISDTNGTEAVDEQRSLKLTLATEAPVEVFDFKTFDVVKEVVKVDGIDVPESVPLLDSHNRTTVRNVLGSIRDFTIENNQLTGRAYFSKDAADTYDLYRDGHLTDFSIGAKIEHLERDGDGNRTVTRSRLIEGSAVVAGADPNAKAQHALRAYVDPHVLKEEIMLDQIKSALVKRGLPEDASESDIAAFIDAMPKEEPTVTATVETVQPEVPAVVRTEEPQELVVTETVDRTETILAIDNICRQHHVPDDKRREMMADPTMTPDKAAGVILREGFGQDAVGLSRIDAGKSEREKFYDAAEQSLLNRLSDGGLLNPDAILQPRQDRPKPSIDAIQRNADLKEAIAKRTQAADLNYVRLPDLARMFLERSGERAFGLPQQEIVRRAMQQQEFIRRDGPAGSTTGTFTNLLADAANKTLLAGYDEAPYTYTQWVRQAPSASDFKTLNRVRFGELADPEVVPENHEYPEKKTQDAKESYAVEKHGAIFSITLEAIINDDLDAMTRIPQMQGNAMRRKVNKVCYAILTANDALSDDIALFHATSHGANLDTTALAEGALDTGYTVMMNQTGLSGSGTPLGIVPQYLIVPPDLAATAFRLTGGSVVPATVGNVPLYGAGGPRPLEVVVEAQLTADSTTAWYLAAGSSMVGTVEVTFLQGEESPVISREDGFTVDAVRYKARQTFNAKAVDFRGLYQGNT